MAGTNCTDVDKYTGQNGKCCDRCDAGQYVKAECDGTKGTECVECGRDFFTATKNHLKNCHRCKICSSSNNKKEVKACTAKDDTVCECLPGFYCINNHCEHCLPVTTCSLGEGVKVQANGTNDTICAPCEEGTFSNVTDHQSACQKHTRCEEIGREVKTPGTPKADAICGDRIPPCHWMLPAGLWAGLVLTALVLLCLICWRRKRQSYRAATSNGPVILLEMGRAETKCPPDLPLPSKELMGCCQESCTTDCHLPLYSQEEDIVSGMTQDSVDSVPITPLKPSVSFSESNHMNGSENGSARCYNSDYVRTYSEPQEDEWCGT